MNVEHFFSVNLPQSPGEKNNLSLFHYFYPVKLFSHFTGAMIEARTPAPKNTLYFHSVVEISRRLNTATKRSSGFRLYRSLFRPFSASPSRYLPALCSPSCHRNSKIQNRVSPPASPEGEADGGQVESSIHPYCCMGVKNPDPD